MPRRLAVLTATLLFAALAAPTAASAAVREQLAVPYGAARAFDGQRQELTLDLYRPAPRRRGKPRPAVVWVHGGGFTFGVRSLMTGYAKAFAERGYVSATISYRLATREQLGSLGYHAVARAAQHDAQAAVRWLRRHARRLSVDPRRIFIGGHSAGAITALEVAVSSADPGASGNPGFSSRVSGAIGLAGLLLDPSGVTRDDAPMLLLHGTADAVVPFAGSESVCRAARRARVACRLVGFEGGDHLVAYTRFAETVRRSARWLRGR